MDGREIAASKNALEQALLKLMDDFELKTDFIVDSIKLKRRRIEAGIGSREALDKVVVRVTFPEETELPEKE